MSERIPPITETIAGDWLALAGTLAGLLTYARARDLTAPTWNGGPEGDGFKMTLFAPEGLGRVIADVWLGGSDKTCQIRVETTAVYADFWDRTIALLKTIAAETDSIRGMVEPTAWDLVAFYYENRKKGMRTSLRQLAEQHRLNYSYLRTVKSQYDRVQGDRTKLQG